MKTENISLFRLGEEYEKNAKIQQFFIDRCNEDIKKAEKSHDRDAVRELRSNLYKFYEIKREMEETAQILKNYYKGEA
ncbi:MAG: hypothetical protein J1F23_06375 [Oscillospiraceae bacterium]|nr:hypothetical protein [Oscillospiraceae bacterium]